MSKKPSHTPGPGDEESKGKKQSRRQFLSALGAAVAATAVGYTLGTAEKHQADHDKENGNLPDHEKKEVVPEHKELPEWLDNTTAGAVAAAFGYHVLYKGALKNVPLSFHSAADVSSAAGARILALRLLGGEEGKELAEEEAREIAHGILPVPALVLLSDATTTNLKIDAEAIFKKVAEDVEKAPSYKDIQRPGLGENIDTWKTHLEKVNQDITDKVAQISAICSVFAPLGTTYTSSALANTLKKEVLRMLYEQSYAQEVINRYPSDEYQDALRDSSVYRSEGNKINIPIKDDIHKAAATRADTLFNGPGGFSNLMITLSANIQGTYGLGDPPEIYYGINHAKKPLRVLKSEGYGVANAQFFTLGLTSWWLKKAGVKSEEGYMKNYATGVGKSLKAIGGLADKGAISVSFNQGARFFEGLEKALTQEADQGQNEKAKELVAILKKIPKAKLQFPFAKYIFDKWRGLQEYLHKVPDLGASEEIFSSLDAFIEDPFMDHLQQDFQRQIEEGEGKITAKTFIGIEEKLKEAARKIQDAKSEKMAELLEGLVVEKPSALDKEAAEKMRKLAEERGEEPINPEVEAQAEHILKMLDKIDREMKYYSSEKKIDRIKESLKEMSVIQEIKEKIFPPLIPFSKEILETALLELINGTVKEGEEVLKVFDGNDCTLEVKISLIREAIQAKEEIKNRKVITFEGLSSPDKKTLKDAIAKLIQIDEEEEDAVEGKEKVGEVGEDVEKARQETQKEHHIPFLGLSHSAEEVLNALLTQIPSVSALCRIAEKLIPWMARVKAGEKPSKAQLKVIVGITLSLTALLSAFADNVAAYMFAEKVLSSFFKRAYGQNILEENPAILDNISIAAVRVAENGGSLSRIGNGAALSQEAMMIKKDDKYNQGISIDEQQLDLTDTILWKNHFATIANTMSVIAYTKLVSSSIPDGEPANDNDSKAAQNGDSITIPFAVAA